MVLRSGDGALTRQQPPSLRSFLAELPEAEILRISEPMELDYVPTALVLELERRRQAPVVLIERPNGYDIPVVANLFASRARIARMAGAPPGGFSDAWTRALGNMIPPTVAARGAVQEIVIEGSALDAGRLPISRHFAKDAGRYIGSGILICKDPDTGVRNLSYQRLQLKGPKRFGASLHSRGHIWEHLERSAARGRDLEVAVVIGVHPAINLAAGAKVASDVDELDLAGALVGEPIELVKCRMIDVEVPAEAEFVLEGKILGDVHEDEGPYGEYTGYSTDRSTRNVFVVSAITSRKSPIYHDIIPGYSAEHLLLGRAAKEAHVFARLKEMVPTLKALNFPKSGTHFHAYMSMKKLAEGQPRHALMLLLGLRSLSEAGRCRRRGCRCVRRGRSVVGAGDALPGRRRHVHGAGRVLQPIGSVVARRHVGEACSRRHRAAAMGRGARSAAARCGTPRRRAVEAGATKLTRRGILASRTVQAAPNGPRNGMHACSKPNLQVEITAASKPIRTQKIIAASMAHGSK